MKLDKLKAIDSQIKKISDQIDSIKTEMKSKIKQKKGKLKLLIDKKNQAILKEAKDIDSDKILTAINKLKG